MEKGLLSFVKKNPLVSSVVIAGIFLLAAALILMKTLSQYVFYATTKEVPFVFQMQQPQQAQALPALNPDEKTSSQTFEVMVRQDSKGNLYAVWDDAAFNVVSIAVLEVPDTAVTKLPDPVFSIRAPSLTSLKSGDFLKAPYKIGDGAPHYQVSTKEFALKDGRAYTLQALRLFWTNSLPQVAEFQYPFTYGKSKQ